MLRLFNPQDFLRICIGRSVTFCTSQLDINNILATHLGFDRDTIQKVNEGCKMSVDRISEQQLIRNCKILQKSKVDLENVECLMSCLYLEPMVMYNRISLLEEMGVKKVSLLHIYRFPSSMRGSIRKFKKNHDIPSEQSIVKNIFNSVGVTVNLPGIKRLSGHAKTSDYYTACMRYYKTWHLKLYYKPLLEILQTKYVSFRQFSKMLDILENDLQFSKKLLSKHRYLLSLCPDKVNYFLTTLKDFKIDGMDIKTIVRKYPRILSGDADNIKELLVILNELKIPERSIISHISILRLDKEMLLERYKNIFNSPELNLWLKHPKMIYLILIYDVIIRRANYLRVLNRLGNANIHTLSANKNFFLRFAHSGTRVAAKKFLRFVLYHEIGPDKTCLVDYIVRHPNWKHVALFSIHHMIKYLKTRYPIEDICQNIHLVLYPKSAVSKMLEKILKEYSQENGYNFTSSQYLALCLYMLEKPNHFSGDGVWQIMYADDDTTDCSKAVDDLDVEEFEHFLKYTDIGNKAMESVTGYNSMK